MKTLDEIIQQLRMSAHLLSGTDAISLIEAIDDLELINRKLKAAGIQLIVPADEQ